MNYLNRAAQVVGGLPFLILGAKALNFVSSVPALNVASWLLGLALVSVSIAVTTVDVK